MAVGMSSVWARAQSEPSATAPDTKQEPSQTGDKAGPGASPQQSGTPAAGDQDKGKPPDSDQENGKEKKPDDTNSEKADKPGVVDTLNSTVSATVDTVNATAHATVDEMRRLPAQWFLGSYVPSDRHLTPLTLEQRRDVYIRQTFLTGASYLKRLFGAGIDQARGAPYEWGGGFGGYGKRFGSRYGQFIIQNSVEAAGDAVLGYEPRYDYCRCTGFWPRTKHAMVRNFVTYNETEKEKRPQIPLFVGAFAAGAISGATWRPAADNPWKDAGISVASQAGLGALSNWLQEFALDIGHKLLPKRSRRSHLSTPGNDPGKTGPGADE